MNIGLLIQRQGPAGIWGPSCETSARLAVAEINTAGGIGGREVAIDIFDAGLPPERIAAQISGAIAARTIDAVVAMHPSDLRATMAATIAGRVPYVYTPQYEGGERAPGCTPSARPAGSCCPRPWPGWGTRARGALVHPGQ
ncbi:ABC transporter substrate-binding protein [Tistrella bauzanensis]